MDWAARLLRNMLVHEAAPTAPYFMLALPDRIYLWDLRHVPIAEAAPHPDYIADAGPVFGSYLNGGATSLADLGEDSLLLIVASWLTELLGSDPLELREQHLEPEMSALLFDSGLYDAAKQGAVATGSAIS